MRVRYDGNVGIATNDTLEKLHVDGNVPITGELQIGGSDVAIDSDRVVHLRSYTVATVPSASAKGTGATIFVSNGAAGELIIAFSDGTDWLRCDTRAAISAA